MAGDNGFLRFRLRDALTERGAVARGATPAVVTAAVAPPARIDPDAEMLAYYEARAPEYDDWYLRRGRYAHGPIHDTAWNAELDAAGRWLDVLPIQGEIVELAAGTGWWSPLLASKGELSLYDAAPAPLERARERLVAHQLRAHLHLRDAWAEPDRAVDAVFTGFWLSHVRRERLDAFLDIVRRWLKPAGIFAFIDSRFDPRSGAADHPLPADDVSVRRLADGREFTIVKVYHEPADLEAALERAGFEGAQVTSTGRFFLTGVARTGEARSVDRPRSAR
jgi:demethylmenaquinone methyltransferase/2-methoxy-6-polyprenyl-1,4-benzoquinol methylase